MKNNILSIVGIAVGVAMIITGIAFFIDIPSYSSISSATFGADFYTYIHEAVVRVANSVRGIYRTLSWFIGLLFIYTGIIDICIFGIKISFNRKSKHLVQQDDCECDVKLT